MPVMVVEPGLMGILARFAVIGGFTDHTAEAMNHQERAGGEKEKANHSYQPVRGMLFSVNEAEGDRFNENACREEGKTEEKGSPAVNCGGALRGVVYEDALGTRCRNTDKEFLVGSGYRTHALFLCGEPGQRSGLRRLRMKIQDETSDFPNVVDAKECNGDLRK